jgi:hypothetical protein
MGLKINKVLIEIARCARLKLPPLTTPWKNFSRAGEKFFKKNILKG